MELCEDDKEIVQQEENGEEAEEAGGIVLDEKLR